MNLQLRSILDKGNLDKERVTMRALRDCDVGDFVVMRTAFIDGEVTTSVKSAFWFPYQKISSGDLVILYTKAGSARSKTLSNGNTAHFFYWGRAGPTWRTEDVGVALLFAPEWEAKPASDL